MNQKRFLIWAVSLAAVIILMVIMLTEARAVSITQEDVRAFSGGSPIIIPAAAFTSDGNIPDSSFMYFYGGYIRGAATGYGCVEAPVYFPTPAMVVDLFASVYDNDPVSGLTITLRRVDNFSGTTAILAEASTSTTGASTNILVLNDYTIEFPIINYPQYAYYLTTCLTSANMRLYSVRLYYQAFDTFLPLVLRSFP